MRGIGAVTRCKRRLARDVERCRAIVPAEGQRIRTADCLHSRDSRELREELIVKTAMLVRLGIFYPRDSLFEHEHTGRIEAGIGATQIEEALN